MLHSSEWISLPWSESVVVSVLHVHEAPDVEVLKSTGCSEALHSSRFVREGPNVENGSCNLLALVVGTLMVVNVDG